MKNYDVIIIGGGPAGLSAGIYTSRNKLRTLILDKETIGGKLPDRQLIENYPSYPNGISGSDLAMQMFEHATGYGAEFLFDEVERIAVGQNSKTIGTAQTEFTAKALIVAGGASNRRLGVPGEAEMIGRGVFYCATCDGPAYADRVVAVAGGGDSGMTEALCLAAYARRVIVFESLDECSASGILQDRARANQKIEIHCGRRIEAVLGEEQVTGLTLADPQTGVRETVDVDGLLVYIGLDPNTGYLEKNGILETDGSITVDHRMATPISGIFAAGDIRHRSVMQVGTAVGDGVTAAIEAHKFIINNR